MAKQDGKPDTGKGNDKVDLVVVVNGDEVKVKAKPGETLGEVATKALEKSENVGQPIENWELRNEGGQILDLGRNVSSYNLADGAILSLTLKAGIAG
jgi:hypothetical protein